MTEKPPKTRPPDNFAAFDPLAMAAAGSAGRCGQRTS
jgi:hypothetical protein